MIIIITVEARSIQMSIIMDNISKEGQLLLCSRCCPIYVSIYPSIQSPRPSFPSHPHSYHNTYHGMMMMMSNWQCIQDNSPWNHSVFLWRHLPLHAAHLQVLLLPHTSPFIHHASTQNRLVRRRSDDLQWSPYSSILSSRWRVGRAGTCYYYYYYYCYLVTRTDCVRCMITVGIKLLVRVSR